MEIGGYFGLEHKTPLNKHNNHGKRLKSGRSALKLILKETCPSKIYLPFYCCDALIDPIIEQRVPFSYYEINTNLEIKKMPILKEREMIIYIDFWGIKSKFSKVLSKIYREQLILDNTHQINHDSRLNCWTFNSLRKFYGLVDGAILYAPKKDFNYKYLPTKINSNIIYHHLFERIEYGSNVGFTSFKKNEEMLGVGMELMSNLSSVLLKQIDFKSVLTKRKKNFKFLHKYLKNKNQLSPLIEQNKKGNIGYSYPYWPEYNLTQEELWNENIFVPVLWKDCLHRKNRGKYLWEKALCKNVLHLPIDHRYNQRTMSIIVNKLRMYEKKNGSKKGI